MNAQEKLQLRAMSMDFATKTGSGTEAVAMASAIYDYMIQDTVAAERASQVPVSEVIRSSGTITPFERVSKD